MDRLALRVDERVPFRVGLVRVEPPERGAFVGRRILDRDAGRVPAREGVRERDGQCGSEDGVAFRSEGKVEVLVVSTVRRGERAFLDDEVRRVEDDLVLRALRRC